MFFKLIVIRNHHHHHNTETNEFKTQPKILLVYWNFLHTESFPWDFQDGVEAY